MAVARDDLGRAARKRGIEGHVTIISHFGIRCITHNLISISHKERLSVNRSLVARVTLLSALEAGRKENT